MQRHWKVANVAWLSGSDIDYFADGIYVIITHVSYSSANVQKQFSMQVLAESINQIKLVQLCRKVPRLN